MPNRFRNAKRFERKVPHAKKNEQNWRINKGADVSECFSEFYEHNGSQEDISCFVKFFFRNGGSRDDSLVLPGGQLIQMQTVTIFNTTNPEGLANVQGFHFELLDKDEIYKEKKKMEDCIITCGGAINEKLVPRIFFCLKDISDDDDEDDTDCDSSVSSLEKYKDTTCAECGCEIDWKNENFYTDGRDELGRDIWCVPCAEELEYI
jgi:hypothetical protein